MHGYSLSNVVSVHNIDDRRVFDYTNEMTIHTLPHLKCIRLVSVRLSLPFINTGGRIQLTKK